MVDVNFYLHESQGSVFLSKVLHYSEIIVVCLTVSDSNAVAGGCSVFLFFVFLKVSGMNINI